MDDHQRSPGENPEFVELIKDFDIHGKLNPANKNCLCFPPRILGYATREKVWGQFSLQSIRPPAKLTLDIFEERLQLDRKYKNLIQALVRSQMLNKHADMSDIVAGKGQGLVMLFHGMSYTLLLGVRVTKLKTAQVHQGLVKR